MKRSIKGITIWIACVCIHLSAFGQEMAKGHVFEDANNNGKRDLHERGVAHVAVSNGRDVSFTDTQGHYQLPIGEDNIIFVIKPSQYKFPVDETNRPVFYYIHKPNGSPTDVKFQGVTPTGPLPRHIDFALVPSVETDSFSALIFGDPQVRNLEQLHYFDKTIVSELVNVKDVAFGISMGDIVDEDLTLYDAYNRSVSRVGIPWHNLIGNHDSNYEAVADSLSDETFEYHYGPANYAFNYGNAHFLILDNVLYPDPRGKSKIWGGFRDDQRDFIANNLKNVDKNKLVVVSFHIPLIKGWVRESDRQFIFDQLKGFSNVLLLSAHTHVQQQMLHTKSDGWLGEKPLHEFNIGTACGSWYSGFPDENGIPESTMVDGTPKGYAFLHVDGNAYNIDYKVSGKPKDYQMEITAPKVVMQNRHTPSDIVVNFFMGKEGDKVQYRIGSGPWRDMRWASMLDPNYVYMYYTWNRSDETKTTRWPSAPVYSTHIWKSRIPSNLPVGEHQIEVKAIDLFGNEFIQSRSFRVEKPVSDMYP